MDKIFRTRTDEDANYHAIFYNGKTMRLFIDESKPMLEPTYPELYDVSINDKCHGGCSYCYASAKRSGKNYEDIVAKAFDFFMPLGENTPFQIAVGGAGEPTEHPQFIPFMKAVRYMNIMPNFTTNGMILSDDIIKCSVETCGGLAVSAHLHLEHMWKTTIREYYSAGARTNMHVVIGQENSFNELMRLVNDYNDTVEYFVLLPLIAQGRATGSPAIENEYNKLFTWLNLLNREELSRFAFGAYFFDRLKQHDIPAYTYPIHMFSRYLSMDDMTVYESSFHGTRQW